MASRDAVILGALALGALLLLDGPKGPKGPKGPGGKPGGPTGPTGPEGCHSEWSNLPRWTKAQLMDLAQRAGFPDPNTAAAVALAESAGDPEAINNCRPREYSVGLWQINLLAQPHLTKEDMCDPEKNAREAFKLWKARGFKPWGAYTHPPENPRYKKYL